ncbi:MAG TPA: hypothetical protein VJ201_07525 [Candidatus Babeliales bacterium]|nr:hypothetical protein [Candidatus Babeliales bacterium]
MEKKDIVYFAKAEGKRISQEMNKVKNPTLDSMTEAIITAGVKNMSLEQLYKMRSIINKIIAIRESKK